MQLPSRRYLAAQAKVEVGYSSATGCLRLLFNAGVTRVGIVITEVYETLAERLGRSLDDLMDEWAAAHPMGRVSTAEEQVSWWF